LPVFGYGRLYPCGVQPGEAPNLLSPEVSDLL